MDLEETLDLTFQPICTVKFVGKKIVSVSIDWSGSFIDDYTEAYSFNEYTEAFDDWLAENGSERGILTLMQDNDN